MENQIIENISGLKYETVRNAWQMIINVFHNAVNDYEV